MISPEEIRKQAERWYKDFLASSVNGVSFFPKEIRFGKIKASETLNEYQRIKGEIARLVKESCDKVGYGYSIEFVTRRDGNTGDQRFPQKIWFKHEDDYLRFIGKVKEYQRFKENVGIILNCIPALRQWLLANPLKVIECADNWNDLLKVCTYFLSNPKPALYIRELPLEIHTKFIEENKAILRQLLDFLISEHINNAESEFEKRFNLNYDDPLIRIKILDREIATRCFSGITDLSIPQREFNSLKPDCSTVFILENKTNFFNILNFLTLPTLTRSLAIFGKGFQLNLLKDAKWLLDKRIVYWGDIDLHGFQILSQLRSYYPQTESLMMDTETFNKFQQYCVTGAESTITQLHNLTSEEKILFELLVRLKGKNRLEQEKIPHAFAVGKLSQHIGQRWRDVAESA